MKFDILHRTRYTYASPARDSFNDVRLEPPSIPEQKVECVSAPRAARRAPEALRGF